MIVNDDSLAREMQGRGFAIVRVEHDLGSTASATCVWLALPAAAVIRQAEGFLGRYGRVSHAT